MSKSIMQEDDNICYLCGGYYPTEWHHIFGGDPNRKKSEHYGLKVKLHHNCHNEPPSGAHYNKQTMLLLHQAGQRAAMEKYGWTIPEFIEEFGRNYF